jgi:esterase/lipase
VLHELPIEESTRKQQHEEVVAVFDELKIRGYKKITVIGGSFGGYMAALLVGKRPIHAAILRVPAIYDDKEFNLAYKQTKRWQNSDAYRENKAPEEYIQSNKAVSSVAGFDGFIYILEHELDEKVPKIMPQTYFNNARYGNYLIIPKTKHSPKTMANPVPYYRYIEHMILSIIEAIKMQSVLE